MRNDRGQAGVHPSRSRLGCASVLVAGAALVLGGLAWAWSVASAEACPELPREDLSLTEMANVHRQIQAFKRDPATPMVFTAREASFVLREEFGLLAWFATEGGAIRGEAQLDRLGRCWDVDFVGTVAVVEGRATVVPTDLRVGELPLGWLVRGRSFDLGPEAVDLQPRASEVLSHLEFAEVEGDRVRVRVDDPAWMR